MGFLRATSSGQGPYEHHRYLEDLGRGASCRVSGPSMAQHGAGIGLHLCPLPQIVSRGLERSVVFEDDVRFEAAFPARLQRLMEELEQAQQAWDLM